MGKLKDKIQEKLGDEVAGALDALTNPCAPNPIATLVQTILAQVFVIKERIISQIEGLKNSFGNLKNIDAQALKTKYGNNITLDVLRQEYGNDILTQLNVACPTKSELEKIIRKRNNIAKGLEQIENKVNTLLKTGKTVSKIPPPLKTVLRVIKFAPIPAAVVPTGAINFAGDILENLKKLLEQFARIGCGIKEVGDIIGDVVGNIQDALEFLDILTLVCAQNSVLQERTNASNANINGNTDTGTGIGTGTDTGTGIGTGTDTGTGIGTDTGTGTGTGIGTGTDTGTGINTGTGVGTGVFNPGGLPIGTFPPEEEGVNYQDINDLLNELGVETLEAINEQDVNNNSYQYKGFTFEIRFDKSNTTPWPLRYAVALNTKGQVQLTSDLSFASDPSVLINELKFLIDIEDIEAE